MKAEVPETAQPRCWRIYAQHLLALSFACLLLEKATQMICLNPHTDTASSSTEISYRIARPLQISQPNVLSVLRPKRCTSVLVGSEPGCIESFVCKLTKTPEAPQLSSLVNLRWLVPVQAIINKTPNRHAWEQARLHTRMAVLDGKMQHSPSLKETISSASGIMLPMHDPLWCFWFHSRSKYRVSTQKSPQRATYPHRDISHGVSKNKLNKIKIQMLIVLVEIDLLK